jgi:hypothetical protein
MGVRRKDRMDKILKHEEIILDMHNTYINKNHDYGDSFAKVRIMYPQAIMSRIFDKVFRLQVMLGGEEALVNESIDDSLLDLANYCVMELIERENDAQYLDMYNQRACKSEECIDFPVELDYEDNED